MSSGAARLWVVAAVAMNDLLDGHVLLDVQCLHRIYLNGYVPNLQIGGHLADTSRFGHVADA
jgi:hypothetical protein